MSCGCKDWAMVGHSWWEYWPEEYPDGHHPDCPSYRIPPLEAHREALGRKVREAWIDWAYEQPMAKPSWVVPWHEMSEPDREVDRRIGVALAIVGAKYQGRVNELLARQIDRLREDNKIMCEALTRVQKRSTELLERARIAEKQRDDVLAELARHLFPAGSGT